MCQTILYHIHAYTYFIPDNAINHKSLLKLDKDDTSYTGRLDFIFVLY